MSYTIDDMQREVWEQSGSEYKATHWRDLVDEYEAKAQALDDLIREQREALRAEYQNLIGSSACDEVDSEIYLFRYNNTY